MQSKGSFIVIDGIDGCGKSSQIELLNKTIKNSVIVRDPGTTELGKELREILLYKSIHISQISQVFLFLAARAQLYYETILPTLNYGITVLCDRWHPSTIAYQSSLNDKIILGIEEIKNLCKMIPNPDFLFILNIDPKIALQRIRQRDKTDRFESNSEDYFNKLNDVYRSIDGIHLNVNSLNESEVNKLIISHLKDQFLDSNV